MKVRGCMGRWRRGSGLTYSFFFQAEDGIRDADVTGVQTCALPIFLYARADATARELAGRLAALTHAATAARAPDDLSAAVAGGKEWGYVIALPRITTEDRKSVV